MILFVIIIIIQHINIIKNCIYSLELKVIKKKPQSSQQVTWNVMTRVHNTDVRRPMVEARSQKLPGAK